MPSRDPSIPADPKVRINSEIGRLRRVIVHSPGREVLAVTPSNREEFLYDDIIDYELSREEHGRFTAVLRRFADVVQVQDLLREVLELPEAREFLITRSEEITANKRIRSELSQWTPAQIAERVIAGWRMPVGRFSTRLRTQSYVLPPLPNLFFTRDAAVVIGDGVMISSMRFAPRWPEEVLMRTIFGFHPDLGRPRILYDGSDERRHDFSLEGGDVHPIREDAVVIGLSERSSVAAVDAITESLFEQTPITDVIAVVLPTHSTAIHLDMVWTQVDRELCVAHPPMFDGPRRVPVMRVRKGHDTVYEHPTLFEALDAIGMKMEPIWSGGDTQESREREQWASGCNFFAVAPGIVTSYARNEGTLRAMEAAGFRIISSEDLLLGAEDIRDGERAVITFAGAELVRGGGGPRCMTCPVLRDEV